MGKVDVIKEFYASIELIRENYKEVAVPIIILLLLSGGGSMGGSSFGNTFKSDRSSSGSSLFSDSLFSNGLFESGLGVLVLAIVAVVVLAAVGISILSESLWLYIYHFFHSLLNKKKIAEGWQARMKRLSVKATVLLFFWLAITLAVFAVPIWQIWSAFSSASITSLSDLLPPFLSSVFWILAGIAGMLFVCFFLAPLWVYYAMDNRGFFESVASSVSLVTGSLWAFLTLSLLFFGIGLCAAAITFGSFFCCLGWLVGPVLQVAAALTYGVTLMKVKLALEK